MSVVTEAETTDAAEVTGDSVSEAAPAAEATAEVAEPAETAETEEVAETAEAETAEAVEELIPDVFDWNGEVEDLRQSDWLQNVPVHLRGPVLRGIENKYRNWQRGYTDKFQELSGRRKLLDKRELDIRTQEARVQKWLHGDVDPLEDKQREIDELKAAHAAATQALREEFAENLEKSKTASSSEMEALKQERDELHQRFQQIEEARVAAEEAELETKVDEFEHWLKTEAPDVLDNDEAFYALCANCTAGFSKEQSLKMVRAVWAPPEPEAPEPPPAEPEPVPEGMKLMNMKPDAAAATEGGNPKSFDEMMKALKREGQREADMLRNS